MSGSWLPFEPVHHFEHTFDMRMHRPQIFSAWAVHWRRYGGSIIEQDTILASDVVHRPRASRSVFSHRLNRECIQGAYTWRLPPQRVRPERRLHPNYNAGTETFVRSRVIPRRLIVLRPNELCCCSVLNGHAEPLYAG